MSTERTCPSCHKPLPEGVELCPECLMQAGFPSNPGGPAGRPKFVPPSVADVARLFPQLEVLELIGQGGMGAVYRARQPGLDRLVALKILPPESTADPGFTERFAREARALAKLNHPHIVSIYDFGQAGGLHYFLMEFVDGLNLREISRSGRLSTREALQIVPQMCDALQFAHDEGIVHRDIKPENVMIDKRGRVKITDFGLAKLLGQEPEDLQLTGARDIMGTPHYMAPEQMEKPQAVDHRADIYSLGVVFYELLTGELPIGKFSPPSRKVSVDVRLDEVVLHTLEREPERRYQHASEVKTDVESITHSGRAATGARPPVDPVPPETVKLFDARSQVSGPATGLIVTAVLNWLAIPLILLLGVYLVKSGDGAPSVTVILLPLSALLVSSLILVGGLMMKRLRGYWVAVVASFLAILVTPGNIIGLPIGIWSLVVLSQKRVREAFGRELPPETSFAAPRSGSGGGWKIAAVIVAGVMLIAAIPVGLILVSIALPAISRARAVANERREQEVAIRLAEITHQQATSTGEASRYGTAHELTLNTFDLLDLDTARVLALPEGIKTQPESEKIKWMAAQGVDLMIRPVQGRWAFYTTEANEMQLLSAQDSVWDHKAGEPGPTPEAFDEPMRMNGSVVRFLSRNALPPITLVFRTGNGTNGLLRITELSQDPDRVNLSFKHREH